MKTALEMEWKEFIAWATGYVIVGLGEGRTVRESVEIIVDHAIRNTKFGKGEIWQ